MVPAVLLLALFSDLISCVIFLLYYQHCYLAVITSLVKKELACLAFLWFVKCMLSVEIRFLCPIGFIIRLCFAIVDFQGIVFTIFQRDSSGVARMELFYAHLGKNLENYA